MQDALEQKYKEWAKRNPMLFGVALSFLGVLGVLIIPPIILSLWRFALCGLGPCW